MISQAEAEQKFYSGREQADAATSDLIRTALRMSLDLIKDDDDDDELARTVAYSETVTNCVAIYFNDLIRGDFPDGVIVDRHLLRKLGIKPGWESIEEDNDFERLDNELASAVERMYMGYRDTFAGGWNADAHGISEMLRVVSEVTERMLRHTLETLLSDQFRGAARSNQGRAIH